MTTLGPWECFQDASYYDMWCVRQVHDRTFGHGFHLVRGEEAAHLRDFLNAQPVLLEALYQYRDDLKRPPAPDSVERRLAMIEKLIAKARGTGGV